ncbi:sigma-70 family RNA polymerase sigma factor [Intestinibacillus massiliensis]|uniref:sigma-70 family RNA polymerase sigma factor n=1 Tax=Intestinibacillus massiliensis TaxID=1871029 RepID=UPI001F46576D|nr:sigma-70 family RNA polymerase sigma factor [Intestinibacillus massiliensis]
MDTAQMEMAVARYGENLLRLAFTYTRNMADAQDAVQDVFVSLLTRAPAFADEGHRRAWLIRATINRCKNLLRSAWFRKTVPLPDDLGYLPPEQDAVLSAVLALPEKYRAAIHLYYYEDCSIREIAALLGKKPATVGTLLARGRTLLKGVLSE